MNKSVFHPLSAIIAAALLLACSGPAAVVNSSDVVGHFLTNRAPTYTFTNIQEMMDSPMTNGTVFVTSYWGSNAIGGGEFSWSPATTTNRGEKFASVLGGTWVRHKKNPREFDGEHWGIPPMNSDAPSSFYYDQARIDDLITNAGNYCTIYWPNYWVAGRIVLTNRVGVNILGKTRHHGVELSYPVANVSGLGYVGPENGEVIALWGSRECSVRYLGVDLSTPFQPSLVGSWFTNHAAIGIRVDQAVPYAPGAIATHNIIEDNYVRMRGTNRVVEGICLAHTSPNNCEQMIVHNNMVSGNQWYDTSLLDGTVRATANDMRAIHVGNSPNARGWDFDNNTVKESRYGYYINNGGGTIRGGAKMGGNSEWDVYLAGWTWPVVVQNIGTEVSKHLIYIGEGAGGGGNTVPVTLMGNCSETSGVRLTTDPVVYVANSATIVSIGNNYGGDRPGGGQMVFDVNPGMTVNLFSIGDIFPTNVASSLNLHKFANHTVLGRLKPNDVATATHHFMKSADGGFWMTHSAGNTNWLPWLARNAALWLNPSNAQVHIGPVAATEAAEKFVFRNVAGTSAYRFILGDDTIVRRFVMDADPSAGTSIFDVNSSGGATARIRLTEGGSGAQFGVAALNSRQDMWFANGPLRIRSGNNGQEMFTLSPNTTISITSTQNSITLNSSNNIVNGTLRVASNIVAGLSVVVSNATANGLTAFGPQKALTNATWAHIQALLTGSPDGTKFIKDDGSVATISSGGSGATGYVTSDQATTSGTAVNVIGMSFAIGANEVWSVEFYVGLTASTAGANVKFAIDVPASATVGAHIHGTTGSAVITADDTLTAGVMDASSGYANVFCLVQNSGNSGTVQLRFASGDGSNTATVKGGRTYFIARKLN